MAYKKDAINVVVSIPPFVEVVSAIAGEHVRVFSLTQEVPFSDTFEVKADMRDMLSKATVFLRVGPIPYEEKVMKLIDMKYPLLRVEDLSKGVVLTHFGQHAQFFYPKTNQPVYALDPASPLSRIAKAYLKSVDQVDYFYWLSPTIMMAKVSQITELLVKLDPEHAHDYMMNKERYLKKLEQLHTDIQTQVAHLERFNFLVFQPTLGYFSSDYGLKQMAVDIKGISITPGQLKDIIYFVNQNDIQVMFQQLNDPVSVAKAIGTEAKVSLEFYNPYSKDYIQSLRDLVKHLKR